MTSLTKLWPARIIFVDCWKTQWITNLKWRWRNLLSLNLSFYPVVCLEDRRKSHEIMEKNLSSQKHSDRPWGPPSLLYTGHRGDSFNWSKADEAWSWSLTCTRTTLPFFQVFNCSNRGQPQSCESEQSVSWPTLKPSTLLSQNTMKSLVITVTRLRAGRSGVQIPAGVKIFLSPPKRPEDLWDSQPGPAAAAATTNTTITTIITSTTSSLAAS